IVGASAGSLTAGATIIGDSVLNQSTNFGNVAINSGIAALTAGTLKSLPAVRGRMPGFGTDAFYAGAHTVRQGAEEFVSDSMQVLGQAAQRFYSSQPYSFSFSTARSGSAGGGYGSAGSVYTNYVAPNAHSACGTLCK